MKVNNFNTIKTTNTNRVIRSSYEKQLDENKLGCDTIELSGELNKGLNTYSNIKNETSKNNSGFDLKRILEIHYKQNRTMAEAKEEHFIRQANPDLDKALYEVDKADAIEFVNKIQMILLKIASGQELTAEEDKLIKEG